MDNVLAEAQRILTPLLLAAATAFIAYLFNAVREWLGIEKSEANEEAIRRAAETEAGKLIKLDKLNDPQAIAEAAAKIVVDLGKQVKAEEYTVPDIKDMIIGAAGLVFPPANILKSLIK